MLQDEQLVLFLVEMFPLLDPGLIQSLVDSSPNSSIESLVQQCIVLSDTKQEDIDVPILEEILLALESDCRFSLHLSFRKALELLVHCISNVLEKPHDEKIRTLNTSNPIFLKRFGKGPAGLMVLQWCGFISSINPNDGREYITIYPNDHILLKISIALAIFRERLREFEKGPTFVKGKSEKSSKKKIGFEKFSRDDLKGMHMERMRRKRLGASEPNSPRAFLQKVELQIPQEQKMQECNPPSSSKRSFTLDDIVELRKADIIEQARKNTKHSYVDEMGKETLRYTNSYRKSKGLPALIWHQGLADIGKIHSAHMGTHQIPIGHKGFNGRVKQYPFPYSTAAENVAFSLGRPVSETPGFIVNGWIDSPYVFL